MPAGENELFSGRGNARLTVEVTDIDAASAELRVKYVTVSPVRTVSNGRLAFFSDPDGNEIVLWQ